MKNVKIKGKAINIEPANALITPNAESPIINELIPIDNARF